VTASRRDFTAEPWQRLGRNHSESPGLAQGEEEKGKEEEGDLPKGKMTLKSLP